MLKGGQLAPPPKKSKTKILCLLLSCLYKVEKIKCVSATKAMYRCFFQTHFLPSFCWQNPAFAQGDSGLKGMTHDTANLYGLIPFLFLPSPPNLPPRFIVFQNQSWSPFNLPASLLLLLQCHGLVSISCQWHVRGSFWGAFAFLIHEKVVADLALSPCFLPQTYIW